MEKLLVSASFCEWMDICRRTLCMCKRSVYNLNSPVMFVCQFEQFTLSNKEIFTHLNYILSRVEVKIWLTVLFLPCHLTVRIFFSFRILRQPRSWKTKAVDSCPFPVPRCASSDVSIKPGITTESRAVKSLCLGEEHCRGQSRIQVLEGREWVEGALSGNGS